MVWLSVIALCFSIFAGYANWPWWMASAFGFTIGFLISLWRMSNRTLKNPFEDGDLNSSEAAYKAAAINAAGVAVFQTFIYFVAWSLLH